MILLFWIKSALIDVLIWVKYILSVKAFSWFPVAVATSALLFPPMVLGERAFPWWPWPPARYATADVVKQTLLMQPSARVARDRCARDSSTAPVVVLVERTHHEIEPPFFITRALRLILFLPALSLSLSLSESLCRAFRLARHPRLPLSLFASA